MTKHNPLAANARFYSKIMGEPISTKFAAHLLHAQTALAAVVFPFEMPLVLRFAFLLWAGMALFFCKVLNSFDF